MPLGSAHMTETSKDLRMTMPGMAHFAGSGPAGKTCGNCRFKNYERESLHGSFYRVKGCHKFKMLTGIHGPKIENEYAACKYFEQKPT